MWLMTYPCQSKQVPLTHERREYCWANSLFPSLQTWRVNQSAHRWGSSRPIGSKLAPGRPTRAKTLDLWCRWWACLPLKQITSNIHHAVVSIHRQTRDGSSFVCRIKILHCLFPLCFSNNYLISSTLNEMLVVLWTVGPAR